MPVGDKGHCPTSALRDTGHTVCNHAARLSSAPRPARLVSPVRTGDVPRNDGNQAKTDQLIVVGASAGGIEALSRFVGALPQTCQRRSSSLSTSIQPPKSTGGDLVPPELVAGA